MAYRKAEGIFRELGDSVAVLSQEGRLTEIDGIGPAIEEKVELLLQTGTFPALERAREEVDDTLLALTTLPGIGAATARKVFAATDGEGFESLLERAAAGTLPVGDGVTKKVVDALAAEAALRAAGGDDAAATTSGVPRDETGAPLPGPWFRRDQAQAMLDAVTQLLRDVDGVGRIDLGGDYVRGCELVRELELNVVVLGATPDLSAVRAALLDAMGARGFEHDEVDEDAPLAIVAPSGMPIRIGVIAHRDNDRALELLGGPPAWSTLIDEPGAREVPVELRDAVLAGRYTLEDCPRDLVMAADLRGELHAHSDWSDGRATILEMARAARDRGDEYFCVTDHSAPYAMVGGLGPDRLAAQAEEIAAANEQLRREHEVDGASAFRVLRGSEVEVLADGSLGLPDSALRQLDWVVASIHTQQRQSAEDILARMRRVIANPLVDAIGHPTSRRLLIRNRTALDIHELIAMCVEANVVLEVNANPDRLDLDSEQAALALAAGARLTINTDAHRTSTLALREHGVAVARRAGARARDVVNCLPADELLASRRRH
jgi:DNA polymerase (family 10)